MDISTLLMSVGFILAAYSVVTNDVIQTLGTFLASNQKRPWYVLWAFIGILAGREYAINILLNKKLINETYKKIFKDLYKVNAGLIISIILALIIRYFQHL